MPARTSFRMDPVARDVDVILDDTLSEEAQAKVFREFAGQALADAEETNRQALGYVPDHETFVDGMRRQDLAGVGPSSRVVFEFALLADIVEWIDGMLILHSPERTGRYARSHVWFADDVEFDVSDIPPAEQYTVINAQPYARKIERGLSKQAPDGVYEGVAALASRRFGNLAFVGFRWRSFPGGAVGQWAQTATAARLARDTRGGREKHHFDWLTRQPAIVIDPGKL